MQGDIGACPDKAEMSLLTEPMYMNCEIEVPALPKVTSSEHKVAAAAIDEALNGLSSDEEATSNSKTKVPMGTTKTNSVSSKNNEVKVISGTFACILLSFCMQEHT